MSSIPQTQKAIIVSSFPGPVTLSERPVPQNVGEGEILVKILASESRLVLSMLQRSTLPWCMWGESILTSELLVSPV